MLKTIERIAEHFSVPREINKDRTRIVDKQLSYFLSHVFNLDININTVIYIGRNNSFFNYLYKYFPGSNSFFMDSDDGTVKLNLYNKEYLQELKCGFPSETQPEIRQTGNIENKIKTVFKVEKHCNDLNFKEPYFIYSELFEDFPGIIKNSPHVFKNTEIIVLKVNTEMLNNNSEVLSIINKELKNYGIKLYDIINSTRSKKKNNDKLFIFAKNKSRISLLDNSNINIQTNPGNSMHSCLIAGSGRSGTSMLAGMLYEAGYYMGENLYLGNEANPKGFFESAMINYLNEDILSAYRNVKTDYVKNSVFGILTNFLNLNFILNPSNNKAQGWLCSLPPDLNIKNTEVNINYRIKEVVKRAPFCYKDPRLSYTLPVWMEHLDNNTRILCVFRDPGQTTASILKEQKSAEYLNDLMINEEIVHEIYFNIYSHIIKNDEKYPARTMYIHYDQLLQGTALPELSDFLNVSIKNSFADKKLRRSPKISNIPEKIKILYSELCKRANYIDSNE